MNRLRELADELAADRVMTVSGADTEKHAALIARVLQWAERAIPEAVCFWMGDVEEMIDHSAPPAEMARLPYKVCWFEGEIVADYARVPVGQLVVGSGTGKPGVACISFFRDRLHRWVLSGAYIAHHGYGATTGVEWFGWGNEDTDHMRAVMMVGNAIYKFLGAMNCANVDRMEHVPDAKIQKARAKRGRQPLFSYWTLHLRGRAIASEAKGGTHASPRVHLRRGHARQHAPGKWTWVQPHMVGNPRLGMVHKDYDGSGLPGGT